MPGFKSPSSYFLLGIAIALAQPAITREETGGLWKIES